MNARSYFGARYYRAEIGRFTTVDRFSPVDELLGEAFDEYLSNPQYWNRYAYSLNNPLKYKDSDGNLPHVVVGALVGGAIGGALELYSQVRSGHELNWSRVATKTGVGAAVGATASATFGTSLFVQGLALGAVNTAAGVGDRALDGDPNTGAFDGKSVAMDATVGAAAGLVGGIAGRQVQRAVQNSATQKVSERIADHAVRASAGRSATRQAAAREMQREVAANAETAGRRAASAGRVASKAAVTTAASQLLKKRE